MAVKVRREEKSVRKNDLYFFCEAKTAIGPKRAIYVVYVVHAKASLELDSTPIAVILTEVSRVN